MNGNNYHKRQGQWGFPIALVFCSQLSINHFQWRLRRTMSIPTAPNSTSPAARSMGRVAG